METNRQKPEGKTGWIFASDFDNTLFFHDGTGLHETDARAIREWQAAGNLFGICTGRSLTHLLQKFETVLHQAGVVPDFYISSSGALIVNGKKEVMAVHEIEADVIRSAAERCPDSLAVHNSRELFCMGKAWHDLPLRQDVPDDRQYYGLSSWNEEGKRLDITDLRLAAYANAATVDYVPAGISKGTGVLELCRLLGLDPEKTAGMGDSCNDLPLIETVSYGFTFSGSPHIVKKAAAFHANSIAEALQKVTEIQRFQTD